MPNPPHSSGSAVAIGRRAFLTSISNRFAASPSLLRFHRSVALQGGNAMKLPRRTFLHLAAGAAALPAAPRVASAQAYPARPVHLMVGFAAGGTTDLGARLMGQWLSERLGQQFVIENRTGRRDQYRHRSRRARARGRLHAASGHGVERDQRHALRQARFQLHPRHRAGRGRHALPAGHAGESIVPSEDRSRVHQLCKVQSRQDQLRIGRHRHVDPCRQRTVQDDDRDRNDPCALSRWRARDDRSHGWTGPGGVQPACRSRCSTSERASCARWR